MTRVDVVHPLSKRDTKMTVVDLNSRRAKADVADVARCECGGEWFVLRGWPSDPDVARHGALTFTASGRVTGYTGQPCCADCGLAWTPAPSRVHG